MNPNDKQAPKDLQAMLEDDVTQKCKPYRRKGKPKIKNTVKDMVSIAW